MEQTKYRGPAAAFDKFLKVIQYVLLAAAVAALVMIPLALILGDDLVADTSVFQLGNIELRLAGRTGLYLNESRLKLSLVMQFVTALAYLASSWYVLRVMRQMLAPLIAGQPFRPASGQIQNLAWTVLIGGGVAEIAHAIGQVAAVRTYRLDSIFKMPPVAAVNNLYDLHLWFVGVALALFFLAYVFQCSEPREEEDEEDE